MLQLKPLSAKKRDMIDKVFCVFGISFALDIFRNCLLIPYILGLNTGKYCNVTVYRTRTRTLVWSAHAICFTACRCILALCKHNSLFCAHS